MDSEVTSLLWSLLFYLGLPLLLSGLSLAIRNKMREDNEAGKNVVHKIVSVESVQNMPISGLKAMALELRQLGFKELVGCTRPAYEKQGMTNFTWVFVSPDRTTIAVVEYARFPWLLRILTLLLAPRHFHCSMLGTCFTTLYSGDQRIITTNLPELTLLDEDILTKVNVTPRSASLAERYNLHCKYVRSNHGAIVEQICAFNSPEDYLEYDKRNLKRIAHRAEQKESESSIF